MDSKERADDMDSEQSSPYHSDLDDDSTLSDDSESESEDDFSPMFVYDDKERDDQLKEHMLSLLAISRFETGEGRSALALRDAYFAGLDSIRSASYYRGLTEKISRNEKLTAGEYFYYALTTDNVNALDLEKLRHMQIYYNQEEFSGNILILSLVRHWQTELNLDRKQKWFRAIRNSLINRGYVRTHLKMFLNLSEINLEGVDLSGVSLDCTDLTCANLSHAILYGTEISYSRLYLTKLNHAHCTSGDAGLNRGPLIQSSIALNADFSHVKARNIDWANSDFTGALFRNAVIGEGHFSGAKFDCADFAGGELSFSGIYTSSSCSLRWVNFADGTIDGAAFRRLDLTGATLFPISAFEDPDDLFKALDEMDNRFLAGLRNSDSSSRSNEPEIRARQNAIANAVICHLTKIGMSDDEMLRFIDAAMKHTLFESTKPYQRFINQAQHCAYAASYLLFNTPKQHQEYYATEAMRLLEDERSSIAARVTSARPT